MNHSYVEAFNSFRGEFRKYKQSLSPFIEQQPAVMDPRWLKPGLFGDSSTPDAGSLSLSSSSRRATPISTPSSDSASAIASREIIADKEVMEEKENAGLNEVEEHAMRTDEGSASDVKVPPQRSRKGHKKSRQGCYSCKQRKIKAQLLNLI